MNGTAKGALEFVKENGVKFIGPVFKNPLSGALALFKGTV
jgi:hypothetical protein